MCAGYIFCQENFEKHQLASLNCTSQVTNALADAECLFYTLRKSENDFVASQFQNGLPSSLIVGSMQETQPIPWILNNDNQHLLLPNEATFLPHRLVYCFLAEPTPENVQCQLYCNLLQLVRRWFSFPFQWI